MKKIVTVFIALAAVTMFGTRATAQGKYGADSLECMKYLSFYTENYKVYDKDKTPENFQLTMSNWRKAMKYCPSTAFQNMFIHGSVLVRRAIKEAKTPEAQAALIDTLLMLQDRRAEAYPKNAVSTLNNKGMYIAQYIKDPEQIYKGLTQVIEANKEATSLNLFPLHLNSVITLFGDGKLDVEDVINAYQADIDAVSAKEGEQAAKVKTDLENLFIQSKVASCDNLLALFTPRFEADPDNAELATKVVKMLANTEGCQNNDLFLKAVTSMHKNEPSASSAYYLYRLHSAQDDMEKAIAYLEEAVNTEGLDNNTKADYLFELATVCLKNGNNAKASSSAQKAAELNDSYQGKAYYIIGTIWGSVACGGNEIEKRAHYWVAVDYLNKAKAADASLASDCNSLIASYSRYFPQKAEAFMYDVVDGNSYTVNCGGMHATTTVRTQK